MSPRALGAIRAYWSTPFVAQFLGQVNILPLETIHLGSQVDGRAFLSIPGPNAQIYVRPHDLEISRSRNGHPSWNARIERVTPLGGAVRVELSIDADHRLQIELPSDQNNNLELSRGDTVFVTPRHINVFDPQKHSFHPIALDRTLGATA
jgi:sulfate/thiosulfate transport system ATP-binding protein